MFKNTQLFLIITIGVVVALNLHQASGQTACGVQKIAPSSKRIIGGQIARPHSWPWQGMYNS
jgi:hypothetical protein